MEIFNQWLLSAEDDINSSEYLLGGQYYRNAIYLTQQCAEKALKGFLTFKNQPIQKTHNLVTLVNMCEKLDADFDDIKNPAYGLNRLDVQYRYPDGDDLSDEISQPDESQVKNSIVYAREILDLVKEKCVVL